ncbi:pentapeptide repeat-containing protein [Rhodovulum sp. DZ06]|uniref:pentapeptide repeat-containing protein n=1 Tax=Rhodovulum sp. DZ06 TaxID=3425126 RepID=UPI003D33913A
MSSWRGRPLRAVVLGRSHACRTALQACHLGEEGRMLHVAPLRPLTLQSRRFDQNPLSDGRDIRKIAGGEALAEKDQRAEFYARSQPFAEHAPADPPGGVTDDNMEELNAEPLLLYLFMLSEYCGSNWETARDNPNLVYDSIFREVWKRNAKKDHAANAGIREEEDFLHLVECLGLAAWQGNLRTGREDAYDRIRRVHGTRARRNRLKDVPAARLENVAVQFYTRAEFGEGTGFEFVHKSFGEYLAARALASAARAFAASLSGEESESFEEVAPRWIDLIGMGEISGELMGYLRREHFGDAAGTVAALEPFLQRAVADGLPVHQRATADDDWTTLAARHRCALTALYAICSAAADATGPGEETRRRFRPIPAGRAKDAEAHMPGYRALAGIEAAFPGAGVRVLRAVDLSNLALLGAVLQEAVLKDADLRDADLRDAVLRGAVLRDADLQRAGLQGADLREADLQGAGLRGAGLQGAVLQGADLRETDLRDADLRGADLRGADLRGADLRGADLRGADLRGADLRGADCSRLHIDSARLQSAIISKTVGLEQAQIDTAQGDAHTHLPDHLTRPAHWTTEEP